MLSVRKTRYPRMENKAAEGRRNGCCIKAFGLKVHDYTSLSPSIPLVNQSVKMHDGFSNASDAQRDCARLSTPTSNSSNCNRQANPSCIIEKIPKPFNSSFHYLLAYNSIKPSTPQDTSTLLKPSNRLPHNLLDNLDTLHINPLIFTM